MQFEFINQDAGNRSLSKSDRCTIRSVSRRVGAATRREKGAAVTRTNALQIPDFLTSEEGKSSSYLTPCAPHSLPDQPPGVDSDPGLQYQAPALALPSRRHRESTARTISLAGCTLNRESLPQDVRIFMLPGLTAKLLLRTASTDVHSNHIRWVKACRLGQESVLGLLPQRYGHRRCLDDAIDCVAGRMRMSLVQSDDRFSHLYIDRLYGRALRSLNAALSLGCVDWTVWYATMLLLLFELLDMNRAHGWIKHSRGGFHVLLALGPGQIVTESDKDLLVISAELMILEATFANVDCFLSRPEWQKALEATVICSVPFIDRSEATVTLWMILARAPDLFRRVTEIFAQHPSEAHDQLVDGLRDLVDDLSTWGARWDMRLSYDVDPKGRSGLHPGESDGKRYLWTRYLTFLALANRFLCAIELASGEVREQDTQDAASAIVSCFEAHEVDTIFGFGMRLANEVARSIQVTAADWSHSISARTSSNSQIISPKTFSSWRALLARVT